MWSVSEMNVSVCWLGGGEGGYLPRLFSGIKQVK